VNVRIWVDADACPQPIKSILYKAAERVRVELTLVANKMLRVPRSPYIRCMRVEGGSQAADDKIAELVGAGDLVITADVPLASRAVHAGGLALNPRGTLYSEENIGERLAVRDFLTDLRSDGVRTSGPPPLDNTHKQTFANELDRILTRYERDRDRKGP
jgi:uncharacterized protein YaiI (UPF0178 family)